MNKKRLWKLVTIAKDLKSQYQTGQSFHVSYIFDGPKLLCFGINSYKSSHPRCVLPKYVPTRSKHVSIYNPGLHSEVAAAKQLGFNCDGMTLVNIRIDNNSNIAYSAPCKNCWEHVVMGSGFKRLYFTTDSKFEMLKL